MAMNQPFRTAFRGFDREDVVRYIEYLNNHYTKQLEDLSAQLKAAQAAPAANPELMERLQAAEARCAQLEAQLAKQEAAAPKITTADELAAYRRAERTERQARERVQQIYTQANAILAEATTKTDNASAQLAMAADQMATKLQDAKVALEEAAAALYAIRPEV